jgi:glutathione S-transferase
MAMELHATRPTPTDPEALADAKRVQAIWNECLAESGGPFLFGTFSIADAMFAPVTTRFTTYQVPVDARSKAYIEAVAALPGMKQWADDAAKEPLSR